MDEYVDETPFPEVARRTETNLHSALIHFPSLQRKSVSVHTVEALFTDADSGCDRVPVEIEGGESTEISTFTFKKSPTAFLSFL